MFKKNRSGKFTIAATCLTIAAATVALLTWGVCFGQKASARVQGGQDGSTLQTPPPNSILNSLTGEERAWLRKHPVISVAQDPGWPPVEFADAQGEPSGMAADYLKLIEQRLGITFVRVRDLSWQEAYARLKRWEIDMTTSVAVTPEREKFWAFTKPYMKVPIVILTHTDVTYIYDMHELAGKRIAVVDGYVAAEWIARDFPAIRMVKVKTVKEGLERLQKGEVFALVDNMLVSGYYLTKLKLVNLKIAGETPYINAQCMAVRKDWAVLAGILQKALDSISERERGEIYKKWMPVRYEHGFDYSLLWKALAIFAVVLAGLIVWNRKLSGEIRHRKRAENALQTSEAFLNNIIEQSPYAIWISDEKGTLLRMNQACRDLLNITDEDVVGKYNVLEDNIVQEQGVMPLVKQVFEQGRSVRFNLEYDSAKLEHPALKHKTFVILDVIIFPVKDSGGRVANAVIQHTDVTKRKQAEEALRESEYLQKAILNNIPDIAWIKDLEGKYTALNEAFAKSCGSTIEDIAGKTDFDLWPSGLAQKYSADDRQVIQSGERTIYEETLVDNEGKIIMIEAIKTPLYNDKGEIIGTAGIAHDITQRKEIEKALREEKNKAQHYLDIAGVILVALDVSQKVTLINKSGCRVLGYAEEEAIGKDWFDTFIPEGMRAGTKEAFQKLLSGEIEQAEYFENPVLTKDGKERLVAWHNAVLKDESGNITGTLSSGEDITERKKAEEALQTSEAELHDNYFSQAAINMILSESLENIPLEMILQKALNILLSIPWLHFELTGSILLVEAEPEVLLMKARSSLIEPRTDSCDRISFGKCLCGLAAQTQEIQFADGPDECSEPCAEETGTHCHYAVPILFGGRTLGVLNIYLKEGCRKNKKEEEFLYTVASTLAGIIMRRKAESEKEKLYDQLLQAQKMEAVGQLAGGIAHDFNNILTAMIGYGHMLKIKLREDDPLRSYADHILSLSDRAANLTQSLLAFSRKQIMNPKTADLNEIIRKVERLLSRIIGEDIELKTVLAEKELTIMADTLQIEQVFMNLVANARDAMPEGGELVIRTEIRELDQVFIKTHGFGKKGRYAFVSVSDSGSGMDEKTKEHIFEPFFTTKDVGKGTGLGLAMAYGIIKQHEGYINVYSESGKGTIFSIYLPLIQGRAEDINPDDVHPIERGTETILLAEDNTEVRTGTKIILEEFGYKVIEAVDGEDAISKFRRYKEEIHFLILDVIMPKKNGKEAYEEIRRITPDIDAVFTSGYTADIICQKGNLAEGVELLLKPVTPQVLLRKIREILDRR